MRDTLSNLSTKRVSNGDRPGERASWRYWGDEHLPEPGLVIHRLTERGFCYGSYPSYSEELFSHIPADVSDQAYGSLPHDIASLPSCAATALDLFAPGSLRRSAPVEGLTAISANVLVGPLQAELLRSLNSIGYGPSIISTAYRSPAYQALLFAFRYLRGDMLDQSFRYTVVPPGYSDHNHVDRALDVNDPILFVLYVTKLKYAGCLNLSMFQPYLFHEHIAHEPWHFRCLSRSDSFLRNPAGSASSCDELAVHAIDRLIDYFSRRKESVASDYIFVSGITPMGAVRCVGSRQRTFVDSLSDAFEGVGPDWNAYYLTITHGFTPFFDNEILERDVGGCTFKVVSIEEPERQAFLTGQGTCVQGLTTPVKVATELAAKANFGEQEQYTVFKSSTLEALYLPNRAVLNCRYGLPLSSLELDEDSAPLLAHHFVKWLVASSGYRFPPYYSEDYARTWSEELNYTRLAYLLLFLTRYSAVFGTVTDDLRSRLSMLFFTGDVWTSTVRGVPVDGDTSPETTATFLTHALSLAGAKAGAIRVWRANSERCIARAQNAVADLDSGDLLFAGHLADLLEECPSLPGADDFTAKLAPPVLDEICDEGCSQLLVASAAANIIALSVSSAPATVTREAAMRLLESLLDHPTSSVDLERGSFRGWESFLSALPLEALLRLRSAVLLDSNDDALVLQRVREGIVFLRRLQFQVGAGFMTPYPRRLEGAVRFSLIDHHFRMDYGIHAASVAIRYMNAIEQRH